MLPVRQMLRFCLLVLLVCAARAQVIRSGSGGLEFQTLTKNGITIMFAFMPVEVQDFAIIQVAVSNGSSGICEIHPRDFYFETRSGGVVRAVPASRVIQQLIERASGNDVVKLVVKKVIPASLLKGKITFKVTKPEQQTNKKDKELTQV